MFLIGLRYFWPSNAICSSYVFFNIAIFSCSNSVLWKCRWKRNFVSYQHWRTSNRNMEAFRCGHYAYKWGQFSDLIHHMTHKHTQNEILIRKRKQNAYEVVRFPIISDNEMKRGKLLILNEDRCTITICDIDEDIVLPSAKKVKTDRDEKDIITDNGIQKSEIEQRPKLPNW